MKTLFLALFLSLIIKFSIASEPVDSVEVLSPESLQEMQDAINSYSLSAYVGYKHDKSNAKEYIERSGKLQADYNLYPFEFNASFGFKNTLKNNETQQNLNALDISIDKYLRHTHNRKDTVAMVFRPEMFLFFQRTTNAYLAIKQKYETGVGFTLNLFSTALTKEDPKHNVAQSYYQYASDDQKKRLDELYSSHLAKYRKLRFALLVGVLSQTEELEYATTLDVSGVDSAVTLVYEPLQEYKWEVRPTITYKPTSAIKFDARAYVKVPFTDVEKDVNGTKELDYYIEAPFSISYSPGILSFKVRYTLYYENAANVSVVSTSVGDQAIYLPNEYTSLDFTVGVKFD